MSNFYSQLCSMFIRPAKQTYNKNDLGNSIMRKGNPIIDQYTQRLDFQLKNTYGYQIVCSFFRNIHKSQPTCVVYLHGFNGSRLESLPYVNKILSIGLSMCSFDFSGTGNSEGDYVSLGHREQFDVLSIIRYLYTHYHIKKFILWGRSMGAVAAIKFCALLDELKLKTSDQDLKFIQILSLILDSPFYSLSELALQIAKSKVNIPQFLIKGLLMMIQADIKEKVNFTFNDLELQNPASKIHCPVLLLASKEDHIIDCRHSQKIYEAIQHKQKQIIFIKGGHNQGRDTKTIHQIMLFIHQLQATKEQKHGRCRSTEKRLQSYQSSKCFKIVHDERDLQKIDTTVRIRYFPQNHHHSFPDSKINKPCDKKMVSLIKKSRIRTFNDLIKQTPTRQRVGLGKITSQTNVYKPYGSSQLISPQKQQIHHLNVVNEKLKKKKAEDVLLKEDKRKSQFISMKSIEEIKPKRALRLSTVTKRKPEKKNASYSQQMVNF